MLRLVLLCSMVCLLSLAGTAGLAPIPCSMPPVLVINGVEMMPLTPFAEVIGANLTEDIASGVITLTYGASTFTCRPQPLMASANGLPVTPVKMNGVTYVPLKSLMTALKGTLVPDVDLTKGDARVRLPNKATLFKFPRIPVKDRASLLKSVIDLYVANADGSGQHRLTYGAPGGNSLDFTLSPDGTRLLLLRDGNVFMREVSGRYEAILLSSSTFNSYACQFTPDGQEIIIRGSYPNNAGRRAIARMHSDGTDLQIIDGVDFAVISPDGKSLVCGSFDQEKDVAVLYQTDLNGKRKRILVEDGHGFGDVHFSGDGSTLAGKIVYNIPAGIRNGVQSYIGKTCLFTLKLTGEKAGTLSVADPDNNSLEFFYDVNYTGNYILFYRREHIANTTIPIRSTMIRKSDMTGTRVLPKGYAYANVRFSPDGTHLLFEQGNSTLSMSIDDFTVTPMSFSIPGILTPDGKYLFYRGAPEGSPYIQ